MVGDMTLLLVSGVGVLLSLFYFLGQQSAQKPKAQLVIVITSQPENTEHRNAIRKTWKRLLPPDAFLYFVLGDVNCPLDRMWRLDTCEPWDVKIPAWVQDSTPLYPAAREAGANKTKVSSYDGFGFKVMNFPLSLNKLGLDKTVLDLFCQKYGDKKNLTVQVKNRVTKEIVAEVDFSASDVDTKTTDYVYKSISRLQDLPPNFEGAVRLKNAPGFPRDVLSDKCSISYNNQFGSHGLLMLTDLISTSHGFPVPFTTSSCPLVSFEYVLQDVGDSKRHINARSTQNFCQVQKQKEVQNVIETEIEDHEDIGYVPMIDSKKGTSEKIKSFVSWLFENMDFQYLLLTKDSSFIFLDRILPQLNQNVKRKTWWASFEFFQKREFSGVNSDHDYANERYPPLSCGPAMVLSKDIAQYIAQNKQFFHNYHNEDASLAIWLSAVKPNLNHDPRWSCLKNVSLGSRENKLALGNLKPKEMMQIWSNYNPP